MDVFLTKQASRLKWITLQTTNSCSVKECTLVKIGTNSCPMVEKPLQKSHSKFRNSHSYLEWLILGFKEYLHTLMFRWRHWRLTATPSGNVYIRRTGILEYQSGLDHSHSMHLGPVVWAPRSLVTSKARVSLVARRRMAHKTLIARVALRLLVTSKTRVSLVARRRVAQKTLNARVALRSLVTTDLSRQGQQTPQGRRRIGSWQFVTVLRTDAGLPHCLFPLDSPHLLLLCPNLWVEIGPEKHSSPDVKKALEKSGLYIYVLRIPSILYIIYVLSSL